MAASEPTRMLDQTEYGNGSLGFRPDCDPRIQACVRPGWFSGAPKIKSDSLRIVVTVGCYGLESCVVTYAPIAVSQTLMCKLTHCNRGQAPSHIVCIPALESGLYSHLERSR